MKPHCALAVLFAAAACAASDGELRSPATAHRPPPGIGSSITHTKLCRCRACEPRSCCAGADEPVFGDCAAQDYDFADCGMAVESCTARCGEHAWRVPLEARCEDELPDACCS